MSKSLASQLALVLVLAAAPAGAEPPLDCENAMTTAEMNACAERDLEKADAELNAVYKENLAAIPGMASDPPYDAKSWKEALRASQRAWVAYRDAECRGHVPMHWTGGSGATVEVLSCLESMTKARTAALKALYDGPEDPEREEN